MIEPKGSITISSDMMQDCRDIEDMLRLFKKLGVPLKGTICLTPHPDYVFTEQVDYKAHTIKITWELIIHVPLS